MRISLRPWWQNCFAPDDRNFLKDKELPAIDAMEDSIAPLDNQIVAIRQLITRFEACYHEADKEAEYIIKSIAAGRCLEQLQERPAERKKELQDCHDILSAWCEGAFDKVRNRDVGGIAAEELVSFIGEASPLRIWQVERIVDRVGEALDPSRPYHRLALDLGDYGEPGAHEAGQHYKDNQDFLERTNKTIIHDTVDGKKSKVSLGMAIDMLMPCHWDFVGGLVITLKAIGRKLHPERPYACCARNIKLSPLCGRMGVISDTLRAYWKGRETKKDVDGEILAVLGEGTPEKSWLVASLDKTIRLHLSLPFDVDLF